MYDVLKGIQLGAKTCATTFIFKNEPPLLNLPLNKSNIEPRPVDNIVFQWTPRHINVSNVEYEFSLVEIWDNNVDPQTAFLTSPPVFQTATRATSFVYGPAQPLLLGDKRYAWQVRAKALKGAEEIGLFKNEGKSEIFWFSKTETCDTPKNVYAEPKGLSKMNVFWDEDPTVYTEYMIAYREKGRENSRWFTKRTNAGWATVWDLKPNTTYEYKVRGKCTFQYSEYSRSQELTTAAAEDETANYNCGIVPDAVAITNREGHPNLLIGDRITAGDFVITLTDISSENNGIISGSGYVRVPYFEMARFGVVFDNILVNTEYQLAEGEIVTLYDPEFGESAVMVVQINISEWLSSVGQLINDLRDDIAEALGNGDITEEEAVEMNDVLDQQQETIEDIDSNNDSSESLDAQIENAENESDKEKLEEEKEELAQANQEHISTVKETLSDISNQLGGNAESGEVTEDTSGFFDGYLPIGDIKSLANIKQLDGTGNFAIAVSAQSDITDFYKDYSADIDGVTYAFVYTSSISTQEQLSQARELVKNPAKGIVMYFHYDTEESRMGFKVEMAKDHFGSSLNQEEFDWSRAAFKRGIKNMIRDINAVDDWSVELLDIANRLNTYRIKPLLAVSKMPEKMWDPDNQLYDQVPIHIEPLGAGITDGAIEEMASVPQLISLVIDYNTDKEVKAKVDKAWEELDTDKVLEYTEKFVENRSTLYDTGTYHQIEYQSGKDVTTLALAATGITATVKTLKESTEFVKDLVTLVRKKVDDGGGDLVEILKKRKSFWDNLRQKYFPDNDWSKTNFITEGINFNTFKSNNPVLFDNMASKYGSPDFANRFLPGIIESGSTVPKKVIFNKGDELYKIVQKGFNIDGPSPYYLSKSELDFIKQNPEKLEQVLGLPLSSNADQYDVFKIVAKNDNVSAFESTIAPTKQFAKSNSNEFYTTPGGRKQTLIIDNTDASIWEKVNTAIETITPNSLPKID